MLKFLSCLFKRHHLSMLSGWCEAMKIWKMHVLEISYPSCLWKSDGSFVKNRHLCSYDGEIVTVCMYACAIVGVYMQNA